MSALAHRTPAYAPLAQPRLQLVWSRPSRLAPAVYWRRRAVAVMFLVLVLAGGVSLWDGGTSYVQSRLGVAPAAVVSTGAKSHVVQEGDTLWSLARKSGITGDIRPVVNEMSAEREGRALQVGEVVSFPGR